MGQNGLVLPSDVAFADLCFRYNPDNATFTINLGAVLYFCDMNEIDACSVIPCSVEANNPGMTASLERGTARLEALLDNWYTLHCAHSGVRDIAYERWLRRGEPGKSISHHRLSSPSKILVVPSPLAGEGKGE